MSEIEKPPFRIPDESDYAVAAELTEAYHSDGGGAWFLYHKKTLLDIHTRPITRDFFTNLSSLSKMVEPIKDDNHTPVDPLYKATHAFRAGMWTGGMVSENLYNGKVPFTKTFDTLTSSMPHTTYTDREEYEENGKHLHEVGDGGLDYAGSDTRQYIDKWGDEIVSDPSVRRYYALGAGAILFSAHALYTTLYPKLHENYVVSQLFDLEGVNQYLAEHADPSAN